MIAVANQKGGVGKTTTTVNVAVCLAQLGLDALVVDLDAQGNATTGLGVDPDGARAGTFEVLQEEPSARVPIMEAITETDYGMGVVSGHKALRAIEKNGAGPGTEMRLQQALTRLDGTRVVLIDCPPSLGRLTTAALVAADAVLTPVGPGLDELRGVADLQESIELVRANGLNDHVELGGVLMTDFAGGDRVNKQTRAQLREEFGGRYLGEITRTVRVREAKARGVPVVVYQPSCTAAQDYTEMSKQLAQRITT